MKTLFTKWSFLLDNVAVHSPKFITSFGIVFAVQSLALAQFTGIKLPALSGNSTGIGTFATAINNSGFVTGSSTTFNNLGRFAFRWKSGTGMVNLGTNGVPNVTSIGNAINVDGYIVGNASLDGLIWNPSNNVSEAATPAGGAGYVNVLGINSLRNLAGEFSKFNGSILGAVWINGNPTEIGTLGGFNSSVKAINDSNVAVGYAQNAQGRSRAIKYLTGSGLSALASLGNGEDQAFAINNWGYAVGYSTNLSGVRRAVLWDPSGGIVDLGPGRANAINIHGQVVGETNNGRAFLWDSQSGMRDLNSLAPFITDQLNFASGINDLGQIVATTVVIAQQQRISWQINGTTPVPEPASMIAVAFGITVLATRRRRAKVK